MYGKHHWGSETLHMLCQINCLLPIIMFFILIVARNTIAISHFNGVSWQNRVQHVSSVIDASAPEFKKSRNALRDSQLYVEKFITEEAKIISASLDQECQLYLLCEGQKNKWNKLWFLVLTIPSLLPLAHPPSLIKPQLKRTSLSWLF